MRTKTRILRHPDTPDNLTHIETDGCIVNIRTGLRDRLGRTVTSIEVIPDDRYAGEPKWVRRGPANTRVVELKTVRS